MFENYIDNNNVYIIAEVGQNHQGEISLALNYIEEFARLGANAVKFQMRDNRYLFCPESYNKPYDSANAFAPTYGAHREFLEFSNTEWQQIKDKCDCCNVHFMCTPFDEPSLERLVQLGVDVLKIASFDNANLPFISKMIGTNLPIVISLGGGKDYHNKLSVDFLSQHNADFAVLHCVSEYPCPPEHLGLSRINELKNQYPNVSVGLSDHFSGTLSGPLGYMSGARVFEKHVTFNRASKGTDHSFALEPKGFGDFVRDIKRAELMQQCKPINDLGKEYVFKKLGKKVCALTTIKSGEKLTLQNLSGIISQDDGIEVRDVNLILGQEATRDYNPRELIREKQVEKNL